MLWTQETDGSLISSPIVIGFGPVNLRPEYAHEFVSDEHMTTTHPEPGYADCQIHVDLCKCGARRHRITGPEEQLYRLAGQDEHA